MGKEMLLLTTANMVAINGIAGRNRSLTHIELEVEGDTVYATAITKKGKKTTYGEKERI